VPAPIRPPWALAENLILSALDLLTESVTAHAPSGNPLTLLAPRERAVLTLLGSGMNATTVAGLLHISRKTLYEDRRRAWRTLAPVIPGVVLRTICGYTALFRWILPREHWLSGTDWRFFPFSI
jgi:hypothetical protein